MKKKKIYSQDCKRVKKSEQKVESHIACFVDAVHFLNCSIDRY